MGPDIRRTLALFPQPVLGLWGGSGSSLKRLYRSIDVSEEMFSLVPGRGCAAEGLLNEAGPAPNASTPYVGPAMQCWRLSPRPLQSLCYSSQTACMASTDLLEFLKLPLFL